MHLSVCDMFEMQTFAFFTITSYIISKKYVLVGCGL